jgi:5-formyltetrahydrofolate cyclo-ligase
MLLEKKQLREHYKTLRAAIPAAQRMKTAEALAQQLLHQTQLLNAKQPKYVAGYWASFGEVPLHVLQMRMPAENIWCLPVIQSDKTLKFAPWRPGDTLLSNQYGIPEPDLSPSSLISAENMDIVLMPLLAYTRSGARLGMGGGYYDRSFTFRRGNQHKPLLIGVAYSQQEAAQLPSEAWDVKLDMLVNEHEILQF